MYFGLIGFGIIAGLVGFAIGLVILVLFLLNLMRLLEAVQPQNRTMSPGLVWLNVIPVFSLGWMIYTALKIAQSVERETASRWGSSIDRRNIQTVGLVYSILAAFGFIVDYGGYASRGVSGFGGVVGLAVLITWIMYWVRTHRVRVDLERTAPGYGPGAAGPGGPYYGPGYTPGQTGHSVPPYVPPAGWQPPASSGNTPAASGDTPASTGDTTVAGGAPGNRSCPACGKRLDPEDQFCNACGTPVPK